MESRPGRGSIYPAFGISWVQAPLALQLQRASPCTTLREPHVQDLGVSTLGSQIPPSSVGHYSHPQCHIQSGVSSSHPDPPSSFHCSARQDQITEQRVQALTTIPSSESQSHRRTFWYPSLWAPASVSSLTCSLFFGSSLTGLLWRPLERL